MQSTMKRVFLLAMVCMLILTTFVGCATPKDGDVYKATKGNGTITLLPGSNFRATRVDLVFAGTSCYGISGNGHYSYSGSTIRFYFTFTYQKISKDDYLTATVNKDGSFTACGVTYKLAK